MNKPYKLIWKFKNDNRYTQYHIYIFIGDLHTELDSILKKIATLNLFETLIRLSKEEIGRMESVYSSKWYRYFFNMYHTAFMVSQIQSNETMSRDLIDKFGSEWYD